MHRLAVLRPWFIWCLAALYFFGHYMVRVGPSVILPELMQDFHVTAATLGQLAAFFYYTYMIAQMPMGILMDKIGPRIVLTIAVSLAAVSALLFSESHSIISANVSRLILGAASAAAFVGALKLATAWFEPAHLALIVGLTQGLGMFGAMIANAPLEILKNNIGWRDTFLVMSVGLFILAVLIAVFVRNHPPGQPETPTGDSPEAKEGYFHGVFFHRQTWLNAFFCGLIFAPVEIIGEFWSVSFLSTVHHISTQAAAFGGSLIFVGWCIGGPLAGALADKYGRRTIMRLGSGLCLLITLAFIYLPLPKPLLYITLVAFGLTNSALVAAYTLIGELHDRTATGLALAIANMMTVLVGALLHPVIGYLMDSHAVLVDGHLQYAAADYRLAMTVLPISGALAFICSLFSQETLKKS